MLHPNRSQQAEILIQQIQAQAKCMLQHFPTAEISSKFKMAPATTPKTIRTNFEADEALTA